MPSAGVLAIAAAAAALYFTGSAAVHGVKRAGHAIHCKLKHNCEAPKDTHEHRN